VSFAPGFDRILVPWHSVDADTVLVGSFAAAAAERIGLMLAHRPGFVAPGVAARAFATLDQLTGGRVAIHIVSGGDDADQQRDGDFLTHDERYARTDEYVKPSAAHIGQAHHPLTTKARTTGSRNDLPK
jgi:alkanesulfonate monooxygenase